MLKISPEKPCHRLIHDQNACLACHFCSDAPLMALSALLAGMLRELQSSGLMQVHGRQGHGLGPGSWIGAGAMNWCLGHELGARAMNGPECIQTRCRPLRLWLIVQPVMVAGAG